MESQDLYRAGRRLGQQFNAIAATMNGSLRHRGPDDDGVWIDAGGGRGARAPPAVDRRSLAGRASADGVADGRYVIIYNGEIYSHEDIRPSLLDTRRARSAAIPTPK